MKIGKQSSVDNPQDDTIDLSRHLTTILRYKWYIGAFVAAVIILTYFYLNAQQKIYRASTTLLIESEKAKVVSIEDVYGLNTASKEYYATQFEVLKSRELAERVVRRLDLVHHPLFDPRQQEPRPNLLAFFGLDLSTEEYSPPPTDEVIFKSVVRRFHGGLSVAPVRNTQLVNVNYDFQDPELAAVIVNTIAEEYIKSHMEAQLSVTVQAADWLAERLDGLRATLQESERRLQAYREQAGFVDLRGSQSLDGDELTELTQSYVEAANARSEAETLYRQVQNLGAAPKIDSYLSIPSISSNTLVQNLKSEQVMADRKVAELSMRYGPKHPKMIAARSDAKQAAESLEFEVRRVRNGIEAEFRRAEQTELALKQQVADAKERFQGVNRKEFKLRELQRDVDTNRELYDMFLTRAKETNEAEGLQAPHARVIDEAVEPTSPIKPRKKPILALAGLLSGLAGVIFALLVEFINNTLRTPDDVEEKLGLPMLGFLPLVSRNKSRLPLEGFTPKSKGIFGEAIRSIRTAFVLSGLDKQQKITVITSSIPGEGKSTVALNLARALSQVEKVLLIDADMRRPTLSRVLDLPKGSPGLSNWVAGTASASEIIYKMDDWNVDVVASGVIPTNPLELISSRRFKLALHKLADHYDRIIIDSAPVCAVSDALMISKEADALIYVAKAEGTKVDLVLKGINRLRDIDAPILGVVLNRINVKKSSRFGDYYPGYFQNYGYSSEEEFFAQQKYQKAKGDELAYEQRRVSGIEDI